VRACSRCAGPAADHCNAVLHHHLTRALLQSVIAGPSSQRQPSVQGACLPWASVDTMTQLGEPFSPRLSASPAKGAQLSERQTGIPLPMAFQNNVCFTLAPNSAVTVSFSRVLLLFPCPHTSMARRFVHCTAILMHMGRTACDTDNVQMGPRIEGRRLALLCTVSGCCQSLKSGAARWPALPFCCPGAEVHAVCVASSAASWISYSSLGPPRRLIRCDYHSASRIPAADVAHCHNHCIHASRPRPRCAYCQTWHAYAWVPVE
jgi:hypothetical protein